MGIYLILAGAVLLLLVGVVLAIRLLLMVVTIENSSMSPALQEGDRVIIIQRWPARWLRKGQIVTVWPWPPKGSGPTPWPTDEAPFIKRIVGMPGDTLVTTLDELDAYNRRREEAAHDEHARRTWHVPPGHIFVRGEHPIGGFDSLSWGPIPMRCVLGVVVRHLPTSPRTFSPIEPDGRAG